MKPAPFLAPSPARSAGATGAEAAAERKLEEALALASALAATSRPGSVIVAIDGPSLGLDGIEGVLAALPLAEAAQVAAEQGLAPHLAEQLQRPVPAGQRRVWLRLADADHLTFVALPTSPGGRA